MSLAPLLVYYGWPSCLNGGANPIADLNRYGHVILGAGLEDPKHPDHAETRQIVAATSALVYGYIDAGVTTSHYTVRRIRRSMLRWKRLGAVGVMLDDFGFGYGVSKRRRRRCVDAAHLLDLNVIANVWEPDSELAEDLNLGVGDFLLMESFYIKEGQYDPEWTDRADLFSEAAALYGCGVMSVTTQGPSRPFRQDLMDEAYLAAKGLRHVAFGWGEYLYSATNSLAPWRARP